MEHELSARETQLVETARTFAIEKIAPFAAEWDLNRTVPYAVCREAADVGLTGVLAPRSIGGQGASFLAAAKVLEELAGACFAFTFGLWVHNNMLNTIASWQPGSNRPLRSTHVGRRKNRSVLPDGARCRQ